MRKIILSVIIQLLVSSCASILTLSNQVIIKGNQKISNESNNHYWISFGKSHKPFQSHEIINSNHTIKTVLVGDQKCWHVSLGSPIIPLPIIPLFGMPDNYSIKILTRNPFLGEKMENKILSNLDVSIIVNGILYRGSFSYKDQNFEFPIKCTSFNNARINIKEPFLKDEISVEVERDTNFYYQWVAIQ